MRSQLFTTVFDDPNADNAKRFAKHLRDVLQLPREGQHACMDALPTLQLARTQADGRRLAESIASSQGYDRDQTLHVLNVANFFADALLDDALPPDDPQFWADDVQELASLDNQDRAAFDAFLNRLTSMREDLKGLRQQQVARGGVLPVFQSMGCTVEVRPVNAAPFRWDQQVEEYEPKIVGTVAVASVYIGVDQGPTKDFHFQADVRDVDNIIASLIAAKKEMVAFGEFLRLAESGSVKNDE